MHRYNLDELKRRLPIPEAWVRLGLPGTPAPECRSPFREERSASFSIYDQNLRWYDHVTADGGDVIDFIARACHVDKSEATRRLCVMVGVPTHPALPPAPASALPGSGSSSPDDKPGLFLPLIRRFTVAEIEAVAKSRRLRPDAVSLAQSLGTLFFDTVCGRPCWLLTDPARRLAEARRIDGLPFPEKGPLGERKAHTIKGSNKSWAVGVAVLEKLPAFRAIMLVEGGPDYLAALHLLCAAELWDVLPVAMLGRSTGSRIDRGALELLRGRRVCVYPHADADGGGVAAAKRWAAQLIAAGCTVDFRHLSQERCREGSPAKDLNDLIHTPETHRPDLIP